MELEIVYECSTCYRTVSGIHHRRQAYNRRGYRRIHRNPGNRCHNKKIYVNIKNGNDQSPKQSIDVDANG